MSRTQYATSAKKSFVNKTIAHNIKLVDYFKHLFIACSNLSDHDV